MDRALTWQGTVWAAGIVVVVGVRVDAPIGQGPLYVFTHVMHSNVDTAHGIQRTITTQSCVLHPMQILFYSSTPAFAAAAERNSANVPLSMHICLNSPPSLSIKFQGVSNSIIRPRSSTISLSLSMMVPLFHVSTYTLRPPLGGNSRILCATVIVSASSNSCRIVL